MVLLICPATRTDFVLGMLLTGLACGVSTAFLIVLSRGLTGN